MKKPPSKILKEAYDLLKERGWCVRNDGDTISVPDSGPLTYRQALWQAGIYDTEKGMVDIGSVGLVAKMLCRTLGGDPGMSFLEVGSWCNVEGRTQEEVLKLFRITMRQAAERLLKFIYEAESEDDHLD